MQRIGVSPDGSLVVFEVTDDFAFGAQGALVDPNEEGIFVVRTDGSGLEPLTSGSPHPVWFPQISPDGSRLST